MHDPDSDSPTLPARFLAAWRKIGGGSLALSVGLHVLIVIIAGWVIVHVAQEKPAVHFLPGSPGKESMARSEELKAQVRASRQGRSVSRTRPMTRIAARPDTAMMSLPEPALELEDIASPMESLLTSGVKGITGEALSPGSSPGDGVGRGTLDDMTPFQAVLKDRCNLVERLRKLRENDGDERCERAVSTALEWLRSKQNADGSWGRTHKGAMTGFALLCYLGRCYDAESPFYGETVTRAMLHLVELAAKNPQHIFSATPQQHAACYEHGIATYALGETWSFMRLGKRQMPGVREAFERGVAVIIEHQLPDGGWGYGDDFCYRKTGTGDLSVTGWQFQALKAANYSGLRIDGLQKAIDRAVDYLASTQTKDGGFGRGNREQGYNQWNLTGVGLLGLQTLGKGRSKEIKRGVEFVHALVGQEPPSWERNANLYTWYYTAQALFQNGGEPWKQWNRAVLPQLLANQNADGSWKAETADSSVASTSPAGADRELYRTALCTLMLEVYYRYLKVGDREQQSILSR